MNADELGRILTDSVASVLEEAVFALVDRDQDYCDGDTVVVESLVPFSGVHAGSIALEVEASGAVIFASDFLGDESTQVSENTSREAIGELANIIAGKFLESWLPDETNYDIGIPSITTLAHAESQIMTRRQLCVTKLRTDTGIRVAVAVLAEEGT